MSAKTYAISYAELDLLSSMVVMVDLLKQHHSDKTEDLVALVEAGHATIERVLGDDAALMYAPDDTPDANPVKKVSHA
jgi:hypothetical protein